MLRRSFIATLYFTSIFAAAQSVQAQCQQQCCEKDKCCRPNHTRIIVWRSNIVSGGLSPVMGGVPPQGYAVSSVPAVMVQQPTIAIHPASFSTASFGAAGVTSSDLDRIADAAVRRHAAAASGTAAASGPTTCQDPCGDILQLKQDVKDLKLAIDKITTALERHQQQLTK